MTWNKIFERKKDFNEPMFPNLRQLVHAALSLSHSNAEAKRIFSIVADMKDKKRNRLNILNLNAMCKIRSSFQSNNLTVVAFK